MPPGPLGIFNAVPISKAVNEVVNGQAGSLHEGVDDNGAHEAEATCQQILAYRLRLGAPQRHVPRVPEPVYHRLVAHLLPHVAAERTALPTYLQRHRQATYVSRASIGLYTRAEIKLARGEEKRT